MIHLNNTSYKKPELVAPAGDIEKLKTAIEYGADAVYVGGEGFNLRMGATNLTIEENKRGHLLGSRARQENLCCLKYLCT